MNWLLDHFRAWGRHLQQMAVIVAIALLTQLYAAPATATGIYEMPTSAPADTWILDEADIISRFNEGKMNASFNDLAQDTGKQVRFVTIHRLDYGETVETFADQLFLKWFPTPESQTNQALLVMDDVTNEATIRSGAAIADRLTADIVRSITRETILYPLKEGYKYNQAMVGAGDRITTILAGNPDPGPPELHDDVSTEGTFASKEKTKESNATVWVVALLIAATVIPMATYYLYVR
jgi:uncharacterized protein